MTVHRVVIVALLLAGAFAPAHAQGIRVTGTTMARYLELRPMVDDSIPVDSTTGSGLLRESARGVVVFCETGDPWCRYKRSADDAEGSLPMLQDLEASIWGLGTGVHGRVHLRGRVSAGASPSLWPQGDDAFDVIAAYVDIDRDRVQARLGRQWRSFGLGYTSFDGVAAAATLPWVDERITVDGWVGRSLVQGLHAPVTSSAVSAVEDLAADAAGVAVGVQASYRARPGSAVAVAYQREYRAGSTHLYSERLSADGSMRIGRSGAVDGALEYDLATGDFNEARLRGQHPVAASLTASAEVRRSLPFFELWTIWGAFAPVGFTEATGGLAWVSPDTRLSAAAEGGWRTYDEPNAGVEFLPMKSDGWRLGVQAQWRLQPTWVAHGRWHTEIGFGASRTDIDVGGRWERDDDTWLGAFVSAFQSVFEFRVGEGRVYGIGLDAGGRLRQDVRLAGDVAVYHHGWRDLAPATDWSQLRGSLRLEWTMGGDPGLVAGAAP